MGLSDRQILDRYKQKRYGDTDVDPMQLISEIETFAQERTPDTLTESEPDPDDSFFDDVIDAVRVSGYYNPLQSLAMLSEGTPLEGVLGGEERSQRIGQQVATDPSLQTSNKAADFIGSVAGSVAPAGLAVLAPVATPAVLTYYGAQAFGAGRKAYRDSLAEDEDPNGVAEFAIGLGYGTAEFLSERFGIKALTKIGAEGAKLLGKQALKRAAAQNPGRVAQLMVLGGKAAGAGAAEESMAAVGQNVIDMFYDEEGRSLASLIEDVPETALFGAAGGGLVGTVATLAKRNEARELGESGEDDDLQNLDLAPTENYVLQFARKNLTSRGNLPEPIFDQKIRRDKGIQAEMKDVEFTVRDFKDAVKESYGDLSSLPEDQVQLLDQALKGNVDINSLPEPVQEPIIKMRTHIDALSRRLINEGVVEGPIKGVIEENMGMYATRAYRVFDDPDWAGNVPEDVRNHAKAFIRQELPDLSESEIEGQINELLYRDANSPVAYLWKSKLGSKDLSVLQKRKDISPEIRALLGEYKDPMANYVNSVRHMSQLIHNHKFLNQVKEEGAGLWFHERPTDRFAARIASEGSPAMKPLDGLYTTPEIKEAFESQFSSTPMSPMLKNYMKVLGFSKGAKTVGSIMTQVRNFTANIGFSVAQGHVNPLDPGTWSNIRNFSPAFKGMLTNISRKERVLGEEGARSYIRRLVDLGVLDEDVRSGELEDIFRDAGMRMEMSELRSDKSPRNLLRKTVQLAEKVYQSSDNFWKIVAFESEFSRYKDALPDMATEEVQRLAAKNVRNTYPTYSLVSKAVKLNRRNPLVGPFVSFPAEVLRTTYHTANLIKNELSDPQLRKIGARRLAGSLTAMTMTGAAATASRALLGMGSDEDEDIRRFVAPWQKNSQILFTSKDENGVGFIDLSYGDPYEYIKKPFISLFKDVNEDEVAVEFLREFFAPFISEEIVTSKLLDIARNQTSLGGDVFNPQAPFEEKVMSMATHIAEGLEPGTMSGVRRITEGVLEQTESYGEVRDPKIEAAAQVTGVRHEKLDISQALSFKASNFSRDLSEATRIFSSTARRRGRVGEGEMSRAFQATQRSRERLFEEMIQDVEAARRLGLTERQIFEILRNAPRQMSKKIARAVLSGKILPYKPSDDFLKSQARQARLLSQESRSRSMEEVRRRRIKIMELLASQNGGS